jgi:hypothetical protein
MKLFALGTALVLTMLLSAGCMSPGGQPRIDLWGDPASPTAATRTIQIDDRVRYVNVTGGEIIRFIVGDQAFAWNFDSAQEIPPFNLQLIAPPGIVIGHEVLVYVALNPLYMRHHGLFWSPWSP